MSILHDITGELLRSGETRADLTMPEKARYGIVTAAARIAENHPWAYEIKEERNQVAVDRIVDQFVPERPVVLPNAGEAQHLADIRSRVEELNNVN